MTTNPRTALVLTGGGARAAYQVGVLQALQSIRRDSGERRRGNPFPIICGTSAGAINAMALACQADHYELALRSMVEVWRNLRTEQVYRADSLGVIRSGAKWLTLFSVGWALARWRRARPRSLLDNDPLRDLLPQLFQMERLDELMTRQQGISQGLRQQRVGSIEEVLIEGRSEQGCYGRSRAEAPDDIDGRILLPNAPALSCGAFVRARLTEALPYDMVGEPL